MTDRERGEPADPSSTGDRHPVTPDGRYFVVRGRFWRRSNPALPEAERLRFVAELMAARREVGAARRTGDREREAAARQAVHRTKLALGERGPPWWTDGSPDLNRRLATSTAYAEWYASRGMSLE